MADAAKDDSLPKKKPKDFKKILFGLLLGLNVIGLIGGGALVFLSTLGYKPPILTEEELVKDLREGEPVFKADEPIVYSLDPFTINLATPRYVLNLEVSLLMLNEEGFEEVITLDPKARDAIVSLIHQKSYQDLDSIQGKLSLKDQITLAVNSFLKEGVVKDVYFSQFVVQSR